MHSEGFWICLFNVSSKWESQVNYHESKLKNIFKNSMLRRGTVFFICYIKSEVSHLPRFSRLFPYARRQKREVWYYPLYREKAATVLGKKGSLNSVKELTSEE